MERQTVLRPDGSRLQAGIPKRAPMPAPTRARGLMLRGVVVATYVVDDSTHPQAQGTTGQETPKAVYCDIITYGAKPGMQTRLVKNCLVLQRRGGLHDGDIWLPKATTKDVTGSDLDRNVGSNSAYWDGDHVLVGFMDDELSLPVILGGIEHPSADTGVEAAGDAAGERRRLKLRQIDGHPDWTKHHGSYYGISNDGNFQVDTRFANDGELDEQGREADPPTDGKGSQTMQLPLDASFQVSLEDMAQPETPDQKVTLTLTRDNIILERVGETTLTISQDDVILEKVGEVTVTVNSGQVHVLFDSGFELLVDNDGSLVHLGGDGPWASRDDNVQIELGKLKEDVNNLKWELSRHRHPVGEFPIPLLFGDVVGVFKQPCLYTVKGQKPVNLRTGSEAKEGNAPMDKDAGTGEFFGTEVMPTIADLFTEASELGTTASDTVKVRS